MNRELERDDVIDLGRATLETKGMHTGRDDHSLGLIPPEGLAED